jgi:murein biosynthesis integral membrane protein MurJ
MLKDKDTRIDEEQSHKTQIIMAIAAINMLLAVVAFFKDAALAYYFGTSEAADAFTIAFFIPDTLGNNILANSVGISCIPLFSNLLAANKNKLLRWSFYKLSIGTFGLACVLALIVFLSGGFITSFIGRESTGGMNGASVQALRIMALAIPLYPLVSIGISMLQVKGRFITASIAPVLFNFIFLAGILTAVLAGMPASKGLGLIAVFVLAAASGMFVLIYTVLYKNNILSGRKVTEAAEAGQEYKDIGLTAFIKTSVYYCGILLLTQTTLFVERLIASNYSTGGISGLNYAYRLAQLPIWVVIAAIGAVILPIMSKSSAENRSAEGILAESIKLMLIATIPIVIIFFILRSPIISILFMRGAFDHESAVMTADILKGYSLAILGQGIAALCLRYFISVREVHKPFMIFLASSALNVALDIYLVKRIGLAGLGYAAFFGGAASALLSLHSIGLRVVPCSGSIRGKLLRIASANAAIALLALSGLYVWNMYFVNSGASGAAMYGALAAAAGALGFYRYLKCFGLV